MSKCLNVKMFRFFKIKGFNKFSYFIPYSPVYIKNRFLIGPSFRYIWRIVKTLMNAFHISRKVGTVFTCRITNRNHNIKINTLELVRQLGSVSGNIHTRFCHHFYSPRIESMGFYTGGPGFKFIPPQVSEPSFSHLAPTRVACA